MTAKTLLDGAGASFSYDLNLSLGRQAAALVRSVALCTEDNTLLTSISGQLPATLGTKTAANSLPVTLASDGALTAVSGTTADAAVANGSGGTLAGYLRAIKDAATDTTTQSPVKVLTYTANSNYNAVAASQTDSICGTTGATGDYLSHLTIQPSTTSPGSVVIKDGTTVIYTYPGSTGYNAGLPAFIVPLGAKSKTGAWKITTGANVSVVALGSFT